MKRQILIIEDDHALSNGMILALKSEDYVFIQSFTLATAGDVLKTQAVDLIILDLNLPDGNGLDLLREIRKTSATPIIVVTANDMELDIVTGLELGGDDYITKPFSLMVLRARVNAQLRRSAPKGVFAFEPFIFDFEAMAFSKNGQGIELSKTEQKLLRLLLENRGNTVTRADLVDRIWTDGADYVDENALSVTIKRLRDKLEDTPAKPDFIKTVYGIGYTWVVK